MPLRQLNRQFQQTRIAPGDLSPLVDIVAIHGLEENLVEAWTDPDTGILWLRDLLPLDVTVARVLTYGYEAHATSFYGHRSADRIQQHAQTLVADLQADRALEGCTACPIIFLCHGLGVSWSRKHWLIHLRRLQKAFSIFIQFSHRHTPFFFLGRSFSTKFHSSKESQLLGAMSKDSETLQAITEQFSHLMKQFHIFFLWEELETVIAGRKCYVVDQTSAAPIVDHAERAGIYGNHEQMIRFTDPRSSSYRTIIEAIKRYSRESPSVIARRWRHANDALSIAWSNEAFELTGTAFDVHNDSRPYQYQRKVSEKPRNQFFQLPQAVSSIFTGREDIAEHVVQAFWSSKEDCLMQQRRFIIYGMGGSGKTQFCSKFAQDHREKFWGVFWIDATNSDTAKGSFSAIGKLGGMEATQSSGKHWLSNTEEPWLLIINNADDPSLNLTDLFPEGERGHVLVTTRNPHFRTHGTVGSREFKGLSVRDAVGLLLKAADTPRPWDRATERFGQEIADVLGHLALALIHAGALIMQRMCSMENYLEFHLAYRQRLGGQRMSLDAGFEDQSAVYATWEHSLDSLQARRSEAGRDAIELLSIVAFFHFEHIRVDVFVRASSNKSKMSKSTARLSLGERIVNSARARLVPPAVLPKFLRSDGADVNPYRIRRALHELSSFSLIGYDGKDDTFSLHPVVHAWARDRLQKGQQELWAQIAVNVLSESVLLPPEDAGEFHEDYRRDLLTHLDFCLAACPIEIFDFKSAFGSFKLPLAFTLHYAWLYVFQDQVLMAAKFGYVYLERGRFEDAARLLNSVQLALVSSRGYKDDKTTSAMLALAGTYWGLGRLNEAIELQMKVTQSRTLGCGKWHEKTLSSMDQLGRSYWLNGQYGKALDLQTETVAQMRFAIGDEHELTLTAMDNLGVTFGSWKRYSESRDIHDLVLQVRKRRLGPYHLDTLVTMNNKAMALKDLNALEEAKKLMVDVCDQRRRKLGKEHPWTLWAICNLAKVNTELGLLQDAENLLVPGIAAGKRSLSDDHLGVLMGVGELARVYARQNRWQEALSIVEDLIQRFERSRGRGHPDTLYSMFQLAAMYIKQGKRTRAIQVCERAKEMSQERLPEEHPLVQDIAEQLQNLKGTETQATTLVTSQSLHRE